MGMRWKVRDVCGRKGRRMAQSRVPRCEGEGHMGMKGKGKAKDRTRFGIAKRHE